MDELLGLSASVLALALALILSSSDGVHCKHCMMSPSMIDAESPIKYEFGLDYLVRFETMCSQRKLNISFCMRIDYLDYNYFNFAHLEQPERKPEREKL